MRAKLFVAILAIACHCGLMAQSVEFTLEENSCRVFGQGEAVVIAGELSSKEAASGELLLRVSTDFGDMVALYRRNYELAPSEKLRIELKERLKAGFYRAEIECDGRVVESFNFGCNPTAIVSESDAAEDFDEFWQNSLSELKSVKPNYKLKLLKEHSSDKRRVYLVTMTSFGGERIRGYYLEPVKEGRYPALLTSMGYGSQAWIPNADDSPERVEFILSPRGQGLNLEYNNYGDWVVSGLESPDSYYYRGAYLDVVRAMDFLCSRKRVDKELIFADGGSQGGALTLALAALDKRVAAIAPFVPFMSDFVDYLNLASWPANALLPASEELGIELKELLRTLSYFDIKNLAPMIECPVLMGFGLQDDVCPPHTNFAGYNNLTVPKRWVVYNRRGHDVHNEPSWYTLREEFISSIIRDRTKQDN